MIQDCDDRALRKSCDQNNTWVGGFDKGIGYHQPFVNLFASFRPSFFGCDHWSLLQKLFTLRIFDSLRNACMPHSSSMRIDVKPLK
ncbi:unnamed protein product [Anisakis simplex]|uniref:Uncharacterized protein n=1 Tax=Anisakis simplex TaxID=6269 RepID=A0A0M3KKP1_ANISI|nr:unnamed protein product [Anisakis simplex]